MLKLEGQNIISMYFQCFSYTSIIFKGFLIILKRSSQYEGLKTILTIQIKNNYIIINFRAFTDVIGTLSVFVVQRIKYHLNIIMHLTTLQPLKNIMFDIMFSIVLRQFATCIRTYGDTWGNMFQTYINKCIML